MIATLWELYNDRLGDFNKGEDIVTRVYLFAFEAVTFGLLLDKPIWVVAILSTAIFFLTFDYFIAYILIKNGTLEPPRGVKYHWWTYKAKAGVLDNFKTWRNLNPWIKLSIRVGYFISVLLLFIYFEY